MLGAYRQRLLLSALAISGAALIGAPAIAAAASGAVETVIVTAGKRAEALREVPMAVTAIGGDTLENQHLTSFADYVNSVPGMTFVASEPGHTTLVLRGINAGGVGSTIGTYLDESPYGSSSALANGTITTPNIDTFDIQRIEVLRGPQGTLYGASTLGGLIKFVTVAPDTSAFAAKVEGGADSTTHGDTGWSVRGMVNIPLTDTFAIRASAYRWREGGFIDDPTQHRHDVNGVDTVGGRASALWQPNERFSVRLNALAQNLDANGDNVVDITSISPTQISLRPFFGDLEQGRTRTEFSNVRYRVYNATVNYDFGFATLTSTTSYDTFHDKILTDGTGVFGLFVVGQLEQKKFTQEVRLTSPTGQAWEWLAGLYYTHEDAVLHQDLTIPPTTSPSIAFLELDSRYIEKAAFANVTYHFSEQFDLALGGRWSENSQHSHQFDVGLGQDPAFGKSSEDVFTWSIAPRWHVDDNTMVYGRVAKGFRPGGPNALPITGASPLVPTSFGSDSLTNYEVGLKTSALDGRLEFDIDAFYIDWKDIQLLVLIDNTGVNANGGSASSKGIELSATWRPIDPLIFTIGGAWTDAKLTAGTDPDPTDSNPDLVGGRKGDPLPYVPHFSFSIDGDYTFQPMGDVTPFIGASWRFVGERDSGFNPQPPDGPGQIRLPSYNVVDLRAGLDYDRWTLSLYGKNVFDSEGITALGTSGTSIVSTNAPTMAVTRPRTIGITLQGKF